MYWVFNWGGEGRSITAVPHHCCSTQQDKHPWLTDRELRTLAGLIKLRGNFAICLIRNSFPTNNGQKKEKIQLHAFYNPMQAKVIQRSVGQRRHIKRKINYMKTRSWYQHQIILHKLVCFSVDEIFKDRQKNYIILNSPSTWRYNWMWRICHMSSWKLKDNLWISCSPFTLNTNWKRNIDFTKQKPVQIWQVCAYVLCTQIWRMDLIKLHLTPI